MDVLLDPGLQIIFGRFDTDEFVNSIHTMFIEIQDYLNSKHIEGHSKGDCHMTSIYVYFKNRKLHGGAKRFIGTVKKRQNDERMVHYWITSNDTYHTDVYDLDGRLHLMSLTKDEFDSYFVPKDFKEISELKTKQELFCYYDYCMNIREGKNPEGRNKTVTL